MQQHAITMLGTGLIGDFYTMTLHGQRGRDRVRVVYSRSEERGARRSASAGSIPEATTDMEAAIRHPETDVVIVALPNHLHEEAVKAVAAAGKAVLCTKPLGRTAAEAQRMLEAVEAAGRLRRLPRGPVLHAQDAQGGRVGASTGALGDVTWVRSRETHPGPHSAWFWDGRLTGGGAIIDLGCHCIEIIRNFVGKGNRPVEVMCTTDTLVHPIDDEDNAIALIRFESGAIGQFEVSWTFRGGMDLRDEVAGTHGTIWLNHFLRTGYEMFTAGGGGGYVAEKAETAAGWLFPVGDEVSELGYVDMFTRHVQRARRRRDAAARRCTTATSSTRSWTPATGRRRAGPGSRSSCSSGGAARRRGSAKPPETVRGPGRDQARGPARRPREADPQGPDDGRLHGPGHRRRLTRRPAASALGRRERLLEGERLGRRALRLEQVQAAERVVDAGDRARGLPPDHGVGSVAALEPLVPAREHGPVVGAVGERVELLERRPDREVDDEQRVAA